MLTNTAGTATGTEAGSAVAAAPAEGAVVGTVGQALGDLAAEIERAGSLAEQGAGTEDLTRVLAHLRQTHTALRVLAIAEGADATQGQGLGLLPPYVPHSRPHAPAAGQAAVRGGRDVTAAWRVASA